MPEMNKIVMTLLIYKYKFSWSTQTLLYITLSSIYCQNWQKIDLPFGHISPPFAVLALKGTTLKIYCGSSSPVNWTYLNYEMHSIERDVPVSSKHKKGYKSISLFNLQETDTGDYYCHGMINKVSFSLHVYVAVLDRKVTGQIIPSWIELRGGESITLTCGSDKPVEWYGVDINTQNKSVQANNITLYNLSGQHSGRYFCRGYDGESLFHATAMVLVDSFVVRISEYSSTMTVHERSY